MYKLVPMKATTQMMAPVLGSNVDPWAVDRAWSAMLSAAPNPWRPISEAEVYKDGRDVYLYASCHDWQDGMYMAVGRYRNGEWLSDASDEDGEPYVFIPTHFIPLEWLGSPEEK